MTATTIGLARRMCLALAGLAIALPAGWAQAQDASLLQYKGADRADKILVAAKKEGSFTFYTSIAEKDIQPLIKPFEQKYGIKVNIWRAGTDKVLQRTLTEAAAKRYDVDAIHISAPEMEALHNEKILAPVSSPVIQDLIADAVPKHHEWAPTMLSVFVQAYNTNEVKKADLPKTYYDLLDPKWKGKLGIEVKDMEWFAGAVKTLGEEKGLKLFRDIVATNGISVRKGHSLLTNLVVAGEVPLALTVYNYMPESAKKKGAPIDWFAIEPAIARVNGIGIARHAPHPNAALVFYDYLLSPQGQQILVDMNYVPSSTKVESPLKQMKLKIIDPAIVLKESDKWERLFEEIIINHEKK